MRFERCLFRFKVREHLDVYVAEDELCEFVGVFKHDIFDSVVVLLRHRK